MTDFSVKGIVKDAHGNSINNVKVFALDSDQGLFEDRNDDLLGAEWVKPDGTFEISFSHSEFHEALEGGVDIYFVVRNSRGEIIARTRPGDSLKPETESGLFEITVDSLEKNAGLAQDPFMSNMDRTMSAFASLGDVATINNSDFARVFSLLDRSINAWVVYTRDSTWHEIRYDGPQVPVRPRNSLHKHALSWEAQK